MNVGSNPTIQLLEGEFMSDHARSVDAAGQAFFDLIQRSELPSLGPERGRSLLSTERLDQALDDWLQEFVLSKKLGPLFRSAALF